MPAAVLLRVACVSTPIAATVICVVHLMLVLVKDGGVDTTVSDDIASSMHASRLIRDVTLQLMLLLKLLLLH